MDSIVEAKIRDYLVNHFKFRPDQVGGILTHIDSLAQMAGFTVDESFGRAGLGAGPEARVATAIVDLALGGGGNETSDYEIRKELETWLRKYASVMR